MGLKDENKKLSVEVAALRKRLKEKEIYELSLLEDYDNVLVKLADLEDENQKQKKKLKKMRCKLKKKSILKIYTS